MSQFSADTSYAPGGIESIDFHPLGAGGEHLVWRESGFRLVRKINRPLANQFGCETIEEEFAQTELFAQELNRRHQRITEVFGENRVLPQYSVAEMLDLEQEELEFLWPNNADFHNSKVCTIVTRQTILPELEADDVWSFDAPYAEGLERQTDLATYAKINERWVTGRAYEMLHDAEIDEFLLLQSNPNFSSALTAMSKLCVNAAMAEFLASSIRYTRLTGESLDLCGEKNVVFNNDGDFRLVDAQLTRPIPMYASLSGIFAKIKQDVELSRREQLNLLNALGYVRTVNFMAAYLDLDDRLADPLKNLTETEVVWPKVYTYLSALTRR